MTVETGAWFAVMVRSSLEEQVRHSLACKGYDTFLPTYSAGRDRLNTGIRHPLLPGYLFSRITSNITGKVVTTPGVLGIVNVDHIPAAVSEEEIERLRRLADCDFIVRPWKDLAIGSRIRINSGPLDGVEGTLVSNVKGRSLIVSIPLLQRSVSARITADTRIHIISDK